MVWQIAKNSGDLFESILKYESRSESGVYLTFSSSAKLSIVPFVQWIAGPPSSCNDKFSSNVAPRWNQKYPVQRRGS